MRLHDLFHPTRKIPNSVHRSPRYIIDHNAIAVSSGSESIGPCKQLIPAIKNHLRIQSAASNRFHPMAMIRFERHYSSSPTNLGSISSAVAGILWSEGSSPLRTGPPASSLSSTSPCLLPSRPLPWSMVFASTEPACVWACLQPCLSASCLKGDGGFATASPGDGPRKRHALRLRHLRSRPPFDSGSAESRRCEGDVC